MRPTPKPMKYNHQSPSYLQKMFYTNNQFKILVLLGGLISCFVLTSCSDNSISPEEEFNAKKENVLEKASTIFPDELVSLYDRQINSESTDIDSLEADIDALINTLNKYYSVEDFQEAVKRQFDAMSSEMSKRGKSINKAVCTNNFGLGFARSVEVFSGVSKGIGVKIAGQLSARGGGGSDYIYDFVNMDRAVYTYSFCGVGAGIGVGAGGGLRNNNGFTGLRKWLWNIKPNQQSVKNRFEGSGRSYALGVSTALSKVVGLDVGASVGYVHEVEWWNESAFVENMVQCPVAFASKPVHGGVKELTFSASFAGSAGPSVEAVALFEGEIAGIYRTYVEKSYTDYRSITGRIGSSLKMAKELILPDPSEFIATGGPAPLAAAIVSILGTFNPSDCPPPNQVPEIGSSEIISIEETNITAKVNISDDGGSTITERGVCWSQEGPPTLEHNCISEGSGNGEFTSNITDLNPDTEYYARAYAENGVGVGYGELLDFRTEPVITKPTIETSSVSSISANSAVSGGNITNDGKAIVTNRGVCWSTSENPTLNDSCSDDGDGLGNFTSDITSLFPNTRYFVRAYATNSAGTGYGNQRNFITDEGIDDVPPEVNDFMTEKDIEILEDEGLTIHKGLNPPNIEGNYYANTQEQLNGNIRFNNYTYKFSKQTADLNIELNYQSDSGRDIGEGIGAFIAGSGQTFSVYLETKSTIDEGTHTVSFHTASIYSGTKSSDGIIDFQFGFIVTKKENDLDNNFMEVGDSRVIYEADKLAESIPDYPSKLSKFFFEDKIYLYVK